MKKIYSTPIVKIAEIDAENVLQSVSQTESSANQGDGMDANRRESNDGLFDW